MKREKHDHRQESTTAEYDLLAGLLRNAQRNVEVLQYATATRAAGSVVREAMKRTQDAFAAAAHQAKRIP